PAGRSTADRPRTATHSSPNPRPQTPLPVFLSALSGSCYTLSAMTKPPSKRAYMISAVAEMYGIHPQTLRLYEPQGLLKPSRTEGNTRLYTDEDLQRLEFILNLARDLGVNISGIAIILQMRERMEEMQRQIHDF